MPILLYSAASYRRRERSTGASAAEIADALRAFGAAGFTNVEVLLWPPTLAALDAMAPVIELLDAD